MSGKTEELKGRVKEAAGVLADDEELEREGKVDKAAGPVKRKFEEAVDAVKEKVSRHR